MKQASFKKKERRDENLKFSDGTRIKMKTNQAGSIRQKPGSGIHKIPAEKQITELPQEDVMEKDQHDDLEYPPPSRNKSFREIWARGIENISSRENFDPSHLGLYETYCHLLVNMRRLDQFIAKNGQTFRVVTVTGENRRTYPEVMEKNKTVTQIAQYAKLLDLLPKRDKAAKVSKKEQDNWD